MSTELFIPPTFAKIPPTSEFYIEKLDNPKLARRRNASRQTAMKRWAKPGAHDFVCLKTAKTVDVFNLSGEYISTYPSARKAASALGLKSERNIRRCRQGIGKQYCGYMFRDHVDGVTCIEPYRIKKKKSGYKAGPYKSHPTRMVASVSEFGVRKTWHSVTACAKDLNRSHTTIWKAIKEKRPVKGHLLDYATPYQSNK